MLFLICILIPVVATAQDTLNLSVDQCIQMGLENSPSLHASTMRLQSAEAKAHEAAAQQLPSLKLNASYTRLSNVPPFEAQIPANSFGPGFPSSNKLISIAPSVSDNINARLTLQQPVFTGFRLQSNRAMNNRSAEAAKEELRRDRSDLRYAIVAAYWGLYRAHQYRDAVVENISRVRAHLKDVENFFQQGISTRNDVLKVSVQLNSATLAGMEAENAIRVQRMALLSLIGSDVSNDINLTSVPVSLAAVDSLAGLPRVPTRDLVRNAMRKRPEVAATEKRILAADQGIRMARSARYPQLHVIGNYTYARPNPRFVPTVDRFNDSWDVSLVASMDLWNWGMTSDQIAQANAQKMMADDALKSLRDAVTREVTQAALEFDLSLGRARLANEGVAQAAENYRVTHDRFRAGVALNSDLLDAETSLFQSNIQLTSALVEVELASARLHRATGE